MKATLIFSATMTIALTLCGALLLGANVVLWEVGNWGILAFIPAIFLCFLVVAGSVWAFEKWMYEE